MRMLLLLFLLTTLTTRGATVISQLNAGAQPASATLANVTLNAGGLTNSGGNYYQTNIGNGSWALLGTNGHFWFHDQWGTDFKFYTNGSLQIIQTNGKSLTFSNGIGYFDASGVSNLTAGQIPSLLATYLGLTATNSLARTNDGRAQTLTNALNVINLEGSTNLPEAGLTLADNTTADVGTSKHGFAPKGDGTTTKFLNANGGYSTPASGGNGASVSNQTFTLLGTANQITVNAGAQSLNTNVTLTFSLPYSLGTFSSSNAPITGTGIAGVVQTNATTVVLSEGGGIATLGISNNNTTIGPFNTNYFGARNTNSGVLADDLGVGTNSQVYVRKSIFVAAGINANAASTVGNNTFTAGDLVTQGQLNTSGASKLYSSTDGEWRMNNQATTAFTALYLGPAKTIWPTFYVSTNATGPLTKMSGTLQVTNGVASLRSNLVAPSSISFAGGSPVNFTNTQNCNLMVYIDAVSVTGTVGINGGTIFSTIGQNTLVLQPNDYTTITYTIGTPTATWRPF